MGNDSFFRTVFENIGTGMLIIEEDTTISVANKEFKNLTGYTRKEVEGIMSWKEIVVLLGELKNLRVAIGTDNDELVKADDHVGMSRYFQIWDYPDGNLAYKEKRENSKYKEDESRAHGDPSKAKATASVISDVNVLVGSMFGPNIAIMRNKFVCAVARESLIDNALDMIRENIQEIVEENNKDNSYGIVLH